MRAMDDLNVTPIETRRELFVKWQKRRNEEIRSICIFKLISVFSIVTDGAIQILFECTNFNRSREGLNNKPNRSTLTQEYSDTCDESKEVWSIIE